MSLEICTSYGDDIGAAPGGESAMSYHKSLVANLEEYAEKWDAESKGMLIYDGRSITTGSGIHCLNFRAMGEN